MMDDFIKNLQNQYINSPKKTDQTSLNKEKKIEQTNETKARDGPMIIKKFNMT